MTMKTDLWAAAEPTTKESSGPLRFGAAKMCARRPFGRIY
jgi:hypothetical protein